MVDLPSSNGFTNIIVVVNRLIKMQYIISINLINTILIAKCFIRYVFKLHKLPNSIISTLQIKIDHNKKIPTVTDIFKHLLIKHFIF